MLANRLDVTYNPQISLSCPRNGADVYYFGMLLQDSVANVCNDLNPSRQNQESPRVASSRFTCKDEIEMLIKTYLNQSLGHFYKNGGTMMQPPVSDTEANDIQPFFKKMTENFYDYLETITYIAAKGEMDTNELQLESSNYIVGLLGTMEKLYRDDEIRNAFEDLISIEKNFLQ